MNRTNSPPETSQTLSSHCRVGLYRVIELYSRAADIGNARSSLQHIQVTPTNGYSNARCVTYATDGILSFDAERRPPSASSSHTTFLPCHAVCGVSYDSRSSSFVTTACNDGWRSSALLVSLGLRWCLTTMSIIDAVSTFRIP